jgi:aspartate/methionine/tyrosine aminotransferase
MTEPWTGRTDAIERPPIAAVNRLAARLAAAGQDQINLGQALLGLPPPAAALDRVRRYLDTATIHGYTPDPGDPEVREAVAAFMRTHKALPGAVADRVMLTCGANQAYVNALLTLTRPGDEVILFGPYYFDHLFAIQLAACTPVVVPLRLEEARYRLDLDAFAAALTPRTRVVGIVSPANPSGSVFPPDEVAALVELCRERGIWVVSDETYDLLTFPPATFVSVAALGDYDRVAVLGSFSKTFALAAWRIGYLYGPEELIEEAVKVQDALVVCAPVPSQMAVLGALEEVDSFRAAAVAELVRRKDALLDALAGCPLLEPVLPDGATFVMARMHAEGSSLEFARRLLNETGIITVPGAAFGPLGEHFIRLSFGNQPVARIAEAGARLRRL